LGHVAIDDTRLWVQERGAGHPLIVLHGGPGLDHMMFGDHLDPLGDRFRLLLVDQRSQGRSDRTPPRTWGLERLARDVTELAGALGLDRYAVLGHSFGAFVALQHAVDFPGAAAQTVVSAGVPSARYLAAIEDELARFEPEELREQVAASWAREAEVLTQQECREVLRDQLPYHFADPRDPRIEEMAADLDDMVFSPEVLRHSAREEYGHIELEHRLGAVTQPVLVLAGRHERTCPVAAAEAIAAGIPGAELVIFEHSAHMPFAEENGAYLAAVRGFLERHAGQPIPAGRNFRSDRS
jgi:proline iminopeptidase